MRWDEAGEHPPCMFHSILPLNDRSTRLADIVERRGEKTRSPFSCEHAQIYLKIRFMLTLLWRNSARMNALPAVLLLLLFEMYINGWAESPPSPDLRQAMTCSC